MILPYLYNGPHAIMVILAAQVFYLYLLFMDGITAIVYVAVLIMSVVIHEVAHGYAADALGDPTARLQGRLTLNPLKHLDWVGSVIFPLFLVLINAPFLLGWAKPVPFNPYNFKRHRKWGPALVAAAGPASNIAVALIFGVFIRIAPNIGLDTPGFITIVGAIVLLNVVLAVFNLLPVPPLDGHHILFALLPERMNHIKQFIMRYSIVFFMIVFFVLWGFIQPIIFAIFRGIVGPETFSIVLGLS